MNKILYENEKFLQDNFPLRGPSYCAEILGVTNKEIRYFCNYKKIKRLDGYRGDGKIGFLFEEKFKNIVDPYTAYFLGFLWADGHFNRKSKQITLEIKKDDADEIMDVVDLIGEAKKKTRQRMKSGKVFGNLQTCFSFSIKKSYDFFIENDFHNKSIQEPSTILSKIPPDLKHYFWRGFFDGDGNLYIKHKYEFSFWGNYHYLWTELKNILDSLSIKYNVRRDENGKHQKYSQIYCCNFLGVNAFINYISQGKQFGLSRKRLANQLTDKRKSN
jgi:hypothetical protein